MAAAPPSDGQMNPPSLQENNYAERDVKDCRGSNKEELEKICNLLTEDKKQRQEERNKIVTELTELARKTQLNFLTFNESIRQNLIERVKLPTTSIKDLKDSIEVYAMLAKFDAKIITERTEMEKLIRKKNKLNIVVRDQT